LIYLKYIDFNYKLENFVENCRYGQKVSPTPPILLTTIYHLTFSRKVKMSDRRLIVRHFHVT